MATDQCLRSVLDKQRKPLGYIDVAALKTRYEAGQANPVRVPPSFVVKFTLTAK
jgi:hypothetical protein